MSKLHTVIQVSDVKLDAFSVPVAIVVRASISSSVVRRRPSFRIFSSTSFRAARAFSFRHDNVCKFDLFNTKDKSDSDNNYYESLTTEALCNLLRIGYQMFFATKSSVCGQKGIRPYIIPWTPRKHLFRLCSRSGTRGVTNQSPRFKASPREKGLLVDVLTEKSRYRLEP